VGKLGDENHGLKMRRDGAFRCCHSCKSDEDGIDRKGRIGVPGDDDLHRRFEFFVGGSDSGFAVGGLKVLPGYGGKHCVYVGVLRNSLLEEIQNSRGECWMEAEHDVSKGPVVGIEPGVNLRLVPGGLGGIWDCFGVGSFCVLHGDGGSELVFGSGELVCDNLPLALGEEVVHHQGPPCLPVHGAVENGDEGHESGGHVLFLYDEEVSVYTRQIL